jgi:glycosyltransferase involved in cell wall biosynthesis
MNDSERVLHVMWALDIGGAERAVYQLVREQRRSGIEADVAVGRMKGYYGARIEEAGARVFELGFRNAYDVTAMSRTLRVFRRYDILHFHSAEPLLIAAACLAPGRRYYTHRSGRFHYPFKQSLRYRVTAIGLRRWFAGLSGNGEHAVRVASALFAIPPARFTLTYNGLDFDLFTPARPPDEVRVELKIDAGDFCVATSGNLRAWKRVDLLLRAIAASPSRSIRCFVIGDGPDRRRLEALAAELRITGRTMFVGKTTNVADYLQVMDAFVLPSGNEEAFGNSAVEAMAMGLPTIVFSDGGGLREHIVDGVSGFVVANERALATRLAELAEDRGLAARLGNAAARSVRQSYSLERMLQAYASLYAVGGGSATAAVGAHLPTIRK